MIERVILSAGAMLIFSVSFQIDQMPEGIRHRKRMDYMGGDGKDWVGIERHDWVAWVSACEAGTWPEATKGTSKLSLTRRLR